MNSDVAAIVEKLGLERHPEGGYFRQIYRSPTDVDHPGVPAGENRSRAGGTLIYFLLERDDFSAFHRVRWTDEIWHLYTGGPIELHVLATNGHYSMNLLTGDLGQGEPTFVVPAGAWQAARLAPGTDWALGGCTVSPGFDFADFQMPPRHDLLERFPQHATIVNALTRDEAAADPDPA